MVVAYCTLNRSTLISILKMQIHALLPMKGHSERVPDKNMRLFAGKPLYHRIASVLQEMPTIKSIVINTDSKRIAEDAVKNFTKVVIHHRPAEIQGDMVSMNDIIAYDLSLLQGEYFLQTHSTNPLLKLNTLEQAFKKYFETEKNLDSLFSVSKLNTRLYWPDGKPVNHNPKELIRTQDLDPLYEENSNFYLFSRSSFFNAGNCRIGLKPQMFPVNNLESLDIDEEIDFQLAEYIFTLRN